MPNSRKKGLRRVGFFATPEEHAALKEAADKMGVSVAEWLRIMIRLEGARGGGIGRELAEDRQKRDDSPTQ